MIFKRKLYDKLLVWKQQTAGTKALLIEGARRIGKSTLVEEFAKNEYRSYLMIDFNKVSDSVISAFNNYMNDLDTFFLILSSEYGVRLYPKESIIIFDEIQQFPKARQAIKYLVADGRFDYIETGSLISIKENVNDITIPSEERTLLMYPMDFEEFAWAMNEEPLMAYIRQCFDKKVPLEQGIHAKAMLLFRQYMIVGGMPKSLSAYLENNRNFEMADMEKRDILTLYRNDIFWLSDSMIANECFNCSDPNVGLSLNEDRTYVKCYMGDTGLLISHTFDENEISDGELYREILLGKLSVNEGMFYENVIAQMLVAAGHKLYFYTRYNQEKHRNDMEIDFILSNHSKLRYKIFPIEVKSNDKYSIRSLTRFNESFRQRIGGSYVIHPKNLSVKEGVVYLPAYMTFCL